MSLRAAAEQALNALDYAADRVFSEGDDDPIGEARTALRAALAAERPQPVAWVRLNENDRMFDVRRDPPPPEDIAYLAKWNRPPWVPAYPVQYVTVAQCPKCAAIDAALAAKGAR